MASENENWEQVGIIGVDAGLCWIGDPCYCVTPDANEHPAQTWSDFCSLIEKMQCSQQFNYKMGHAGLGVCIGGFGGDGSFPVFIRKNKEGQVVEAKVVFED